jgi:uncharacterized protein YcbX
MAMLQSIHLYPVKSGAALAPDTARVGSCGLDHDRRWMVVDAEARFLTARRWPRLTLIRALPGPDGALDLDAPGMAPLHLAAPAPDTPRIAVTIWNSHVDALPGDPAGDAWISRFLGCACRLVHMDAACLRAVDPDHARPGDVVSFADGFPLLLVTAAALDVLNGKLARPLPMLRFRPNLVVAGTAAHAEDDWRRIRIGAIEFDVVKPCIRCVLTTVDFERGDFDPDGEPLRTLLTYRRGADGVAFGQNLIPRGRGTLHVGNGVEILD